MCIDIVEIWFGIANGQISLNFYGVICPIMAGCYSLTFLFGGKISIYLNKRVFIMINNILCLYLNILSRLSLTRTFGLL